MKNKRMFQIRVALLVSFITVTLNLSADPGSESGKLLKKLDLDRPGLERVKALSGDSSSAVRELLVYLRDRTSVKHPVSREAKATSLGNYASTGDMKAADNALKHIFVGQSAYPPYFCGDDINWGYRPVPDNEWVWQLNRMGFWQSLSAAYWHTGDEKYAKEWSYQLLDWTKKNPRDKAHDYAWRSIEAGIRGNGWMTLYQRFIDSPSFTPEVLTAFLNSCYEHASFLMTRYSKGSNWALMEAEGLAYIAFMFPEFKEAVTWRTEAINRLNKEITNQVYPDGHQRELAMGYHLGSIGWFTRTYDLAKMNGLTDVFPQSYKTVVEKMCEVPMKLGLPDGTSTQFGDSWAGSPGNLWRNLREYAKVYNRPDFLYVATEGKEGEMPDQTAYALEKSGFYSMRSGWDKMAICLVLKCGPDGGGHCQPDNGTFELFAGGRNLMPDAGSFIYSGDPVNRAWFRQTKVHQTITLNGGNSAYAPKLIKWQPGSTMDILVVENASYKNLTHRRAVIFVDKKYFLVIDEAYGTAGGDVDLHFQLAPGPSVLDNKNLTAGTSFTDGWNVLVKTLNQNGVTMSEEEGQVSFVYTKKEPRPAFCFRLQKTEQQKGVRFVTVVAPYGGKIPEVVISPLKSAEIPASSVSVNVKYNGKTSRINYSLE